MSLKQVQKSGSSGDVRSIDVVTLRAPGAKPVNKNFLLFGEHSRELISAESGLHFVKALCGEIPSFAADAQRILEDNEFQIVVNGNPASRRKVEEGDYCLRTNPNGVDLNRNWDEKWQASAVLDAEDTNPGPSPFSEPETRVFKELVEDYQPTMFLTIHSGTKGMYMPWAYDMGHLASRNEPQMMEILKEIDSEHCECPFGAAGREVGYSCPGTCLDWVYDKLKTPYAFAFEIYTGAEEAMMLRQRWQEKINEDGAASLLQRSHLGHAKFRSFFEEHPSSFVQLRSQHRHDWVRPAQECFEQFNPGNEKEFKEVLDNWSAAYLAVAAKVTTRLKSATVTPSNATY